jgi:hypothetical protein
MTMELPKRRRLEVLKEQASEERAMQRELERLDRLTLERIEQRFGPYIPKERLEHVKQERTRFLHDLEYRRHLAQEYGASIKPDEQCLGDYHPESGEINVNRDHPLVPLTLAHERLHQVRDPRFRDLLGSRLDEGMTEHLAQEVFTDPQIKDLGQSYPSERRLVEMMIARVGSQPLKRAYFRGEWIPLKERVDRELGNGALAEIVQHTEQGRYEEAEQIIKRNLRG